MFSSADKNVKLWGLDFGDCHKSFFAHQDVITGVKFVGTTHHFFTVGKDKLVKQWDGDKFEPIMTLTVRAPLVRPAPAGIAYPC